MNRVHSFEALHKAGHVGIAVRAISKSQRHVGVLHKEEESLPPRLLHLRFHRELADEPLDNSYLWVAPAIHPSRLRQVAAVCRLVWNANGKGSIPFGFSEPSDCFDEHTCRFLFGPTKLGLTCASFVLAVFHRAGLAIADYSTWPQREGDQEWQSNVLEALQGVADQQHIDALKEEVGRKATRYRPEEVAASAAETTLPVPFQVASRRARCIVALLTRQSEPTKERPSRNCPADASGS